MRCMMCHCPLTDDEAIYRLQLYKKVLPRPKKEILQQVSELPEDSDVRRMLASRMFSIIDLCGRLYISACEDCARKIVMARYSPPEWAACWHQPVKHCDSGCGRLVYCDIRRKRRWHTLCGSRDCHNVFYARRKRQQRKIAYRKKIKCAAGCDTEFKPKRADALYCSPACRQWAYRNRILG